MTKSPRLIAFETLYSIFYNGSYSNIALDKALSNVVYDKAFISSLVYGVTERKLTLDYFINKYASGRIKPKIRVILWLGAYQILFMDKIPTSAAINESVKLTKQIKQEYYSKLVNAVLHKIDKNRVLPDDLSVKYSVPKNLINMWVKQYGEETVTEFLPSVNYRPPLFAIPNKKVVNSDELVYELDCDETKCEAYNEFVLINEANNLTKSKAFKNGLFYIEDLSSFYCAKAIGAKPGDTVLDMCSAPGGKAFTMSQDMNNQGKIYCFDLYPHRLKLIEDSAARLGINIIKTAVNNATVYNSSIPNADKILCDVPCSGFGIIRRKPEIRYKELDSVKELPLIQYSILKTSAKYLKKGGKIIYSTCTLNKKENEQVVSRFLDNNNNFKLIDEKTIFPSNYGGDGFYYALMKKNED